MKPYILAVSASVLFLASASNSRRLVCCSSPKYIAPRQYTGVQFTIDPALQRGCRLSGEYVAAGGEHNDIQVVIGDRNEVLNYINGNGGTVMLLEKKTAGNIDLEMPDGAGSYALVFNNRISVVSSKRVSAKIELFCTPGRPHQAQ